MFETSIHKRGQIHVFELKESQIIYTLAPGAKNCELLVKRDLQAFNGHSFINYIIILTVLLIMHTTCMQTVYYYKLQCTEN